VDSGRAISFVTLGTRDLSTLRSFYRSWGWTERDGGDDEFAQFDAGGVRHERGSRWTGSGSGCRPGPALDGWTSVASG
jgi:hypothetical protein